MYLLFFVERSSVPSYLGQFLTVLGGVRCVRKLLAISNESTRCTDTKIRRSRGISPGATLQIVGHRFHPLHEDFRSAKCSASVGWLHVSVSWTFGAKRLTFEYKRDLLLICCLPWPVQLPHRPELCAEPCQSGLIHNSEYFFEVIELSSAYSHSPHIYFAFLVGTVAGSLLSQE